VLVARLDFAQTKIIKMKDTEKLLQQALYLIFMLSNGYFKQDKADEFMKKCEYDFYKRDKNNDLNNH
jgi:hypothetical protein